MTKGQARTLNALYAVDVFLEFFAARIPNTAANPARQRFARALAELIWHVDTQEAAPLMSRGLTRGKRVKVTALKRDHMRHIVRIARLEAADIPELAALKMPRGEVGIHKLLNSATAMAVIAGEHRDVFIAGGCKPSFVDDLHAAIDDITQTLTSRTQRNGDRAAATIGLKVLLTRCTKLVAILDGFIQTEARDDVALLASWASMKRARRNPARRNAIEQQTSAVKETEAKALPTEPIRDPARLLQGINPHLAVTTHAPRPLTAVVRAEI
jgi:hypothetical protein